MTDDVNYQQLWQLAEANVRALEEERNELARQLGQEVARTQAALKLASDWERGFKEFEILYMELADQFVEYKKAHP